MKEELSPMDDSTIRITASSVVHDDTVRETLLGFASTRALPAPEESTPEWDAWNIAAAAAFRAVVASIDHYCAVRVLNALLAARAAPQEEASTG